MTYVLFSPHNSDVVCLAVYSMGTLPFDVVLAVVLSSFSEFFYAGAVLPIILALPPEFGSFLRSMRFV